MRAFLSLQRGNSGQVSFRAPAFMQATRFRLFSISLTMSATDMCCGFFPNSIPPFRPLMLFRKLAETNVMTTFIK